MTHRSEPDRPICPERLVEHDRSCRVTRGTETKTLEEATAASHAACSGHREQRRRQVKRERSHRQASKGTIPPFTGSVDAEDIDNSLKAIVDSKQTELLFVALFLRMLKMGGRCACIVPNGVLFRTNSKAYTQLRKELVDRQRLEAIIYMPSGVFKPYSGVSTAILVFTKTDAGGTDDVWLYNMEGDGFTLDDKRDPDEGHNDIPDILERWSNLDGERERARTEKCFLVPKAEIVENDYDFSFNKYTETVYERVEYPPTEEILADLEAINQRIADGLSELRSMLGGGRDA